MPSLNVQFADAAEETIIAYFGSPQSAEIYSNLGTVTTSDARWNAFYNAVGETQSGLPAPTAS